MGVGWVGGNRGMGEGEKGVPVQCRSDVIKPSKPTIP